MDYFKDRFNKDFTRKMKILNQKVKAEKLINRDQANWSISKCISTKLF